MIQNSKLFFCCLISLGATFLGATSQSKAKPNLVIVMADDLGWSDTSNSITNLGNPSDFYETPAIDRLASEGMAFTDAYVNQNCSPTRAAILTGQYAPRETNNVYQVANLNRGGKNTLLLGPTQGLPSGKEGVPKNAFTYAEMLQAAGYTTAHFGKFHATDKGPAGTKQIKTNHGFDFNYGGTDRGHPENYHASQQIFDPSIGPELDLYAANYTQEFVDQKIKPFSNSTSETAINELVGTPKHVSDALADAAIDFMEANKAAPFLVQYHPYAVHTPIDKLQARADLLDKYLKKPAGNADSHTSFAALIEGMDQAIARLIKYLQTTPDPSRPHQTLDQNTIVVFLSDNGGKQNQSNNGPLRGQKGELYEGGIRVPLIVWSGNPQLVDGGTVNNTPVLGIDLYKTFITLSESTPPPEVTLDGADLTPLIADHSNTLDRNAIYWHLPGYLIQSGRDQRPQSVVRSGKWKLLYNYEDQSYELYDLESDISESKNLAAEKPTAVNRLAHLLMQWLEEVNAPLARLRTGKMTVQINGEASCYANGQITTAQNSLVINAGEEVPLVINNAR